jgi:hypothetical protein
MRLGHGHRRAARGLVRAVEPEGPHEADEPLLEQQLALELGRGRVGHGSTVQPIGSDTTNATTWYARRRTQPAALVAAESTEPARVAAR